MKKYQLEDLVYLMQRLREPEFGCPWDRKQDFSSLVPYTLEECYEVVDAIEHRDWPHLAEELGDLLFQIIFYSQLAVENQHFDLTDVIHSIVTKLLRRHPHVFPNGDLQARSTLQLSEAQISENWQQIKAWERRQKNTQVTTENKLLDDIPTALPALLRAEKLQRRAATVGFDWDDLTPVIAKIEEELAELKEAIASRDSAHIQDEMGDVFFAQVNLARHLGISPEAALRGTNDKFTRRFNDVEKSVNGADKNWQEHSLDELETFWQQAKKKGL